MSVSAPRWDLSNVYPSLDSKEFKSAVEDYKKQVAALEKFFRNKLSKANARTKASELAPLVGKAIDQIKPDPVKQYIEGGRVPWSEGYSKYRTQLIREAFRNETLMAALREDRPLPAGHGVGVDERSVGGAVKGFGRRSGAAQHVFRGDGPPGFGADAAEGDAGVADSAAVHPEDHGSRGEGELETLTIAQFQVMLP